MSVGDRLTSKWARVKALRQQVSTAQSFLVRALVGDRIGLVLFLASLCFFGLYWRIGFFINDNITLANGLVALSEGRLHLIEAQYGTLSSPGMHIVDGRLYARNYGQIALALPILFALKRAVLVFDAGLLFAASWSLFILALGVLIGRVLERQRVFAVGGVIVSVGLFLSNLAVGRTLDTEMLPVVALQLATMFATAFAAVTLYRLLSRIHNRRVGSASAAVVIAATAVGFWAMIPKRHAFTVAAILGISYALYRSRENSTSDSVITPVGFRALAYAIVGLYTWVHAAEGLLLLAGLTVVDFPTAPSNDARTLATVGLTFTVSMLPFLVSNILISGNPLRPPRMLPNYESGAAALDLSTGGSTSTGSGGGSQSFLPPLVETLISDTKRIVSIFTGFYTSGVDILLSSPERLVQVFVYAGFIDYVSVENANQSIYLTVLESTPIVAGVAVIANSIIRRVLSVRRVVNVETPRRFNPRTWSPETVVDAFAVVVFVSFVLVFIPRLPLHAQITVRYLLPVFALGIYAIARQEGIRRVLGTHGRLGLWSWVIGVCIGGQILLTVVVLGNFGRGEAFQLHAFLALLLAVPVALCAVATVFTERFDRVTAVAFGLAAALGTNFLLLSGLLYVQYGQYALPVVDTLSKLLSLA